MVKPFSVTVNPFATGIHSNSAPSHGPEIQPRGQEATTRYSAHVEESLGVCLPAKAPHHSGSFARVPEPARTAVIESHLVQSTGNPAGVRGHVDPQASAPHAHGDGAAGVVKPTDLSASQWLALLPDPSTLTAGLQQARDQLLAVERSLDMQYGQGDQATWWSLLQAIDEGITALASGLTCLRERLPCTWMDARDGTVHEHPVTGLADFALWRVPLVDQLVSHGVDVNAMECGWATLRGLLLEEVRRVQRAADSIHALVATAQQEEPAPPPSPFFFSRQDLARALPRCFEQNMQRLLDECGRLYQHIQRGTRSQPVLAGLLDSLAVDLATAGAPLILLPVFDHLAYPCTTETAELQPLQAFTAVARHVDLQQWSLRLREDSLNPEEMQTLKGVVAEIAHRAHAAGQAASSLVHG